MDDSELVRARHVVKSFGKTQALADASLTIRRGQVHALLGGNGAGKSTLISIISGLIRPDAGELDISLNEIAVVHQEPAVMPELTVAENVMLGRMPGWRFRWNLAIHETERVLGQLGVTTDAITPVAAAGSLGLHQLQLIEVARALSGGARLILLDEPTASLTAEETQRLFAVLRRLAAQGIGFVLVSHRMHEIRQVADCCTVLRDGRTVIDGAQLDTLSDTDIVRGMFAREDVTAGLAAPDRGRRYATKPAGGDRPAGEGLVLTHRPTGIRAELRPGEVLGLAGTAQGPTQLLDTLMGLHRMAAWAVTLEGSAWAPRSPRQAIRHGAGYVSGDRAGKGLLPHLSIRDNVAVAHQVVSGQWLRRSSDTAMAERLAAALGFSGKDIGTPPGTLSGGMQQKILLARWLELPLRLLLLEEPTRGVDVQTKTDLYQMVRGLREQGVVTVWWSTEHAELLAVSDQVLAFTLAGRPGELLGAGATDEDTLVAATGTA